MSHIATVAIEIRDLDALEAACRELGATLHRNVKTYNWYGRSGGDAPIPEGMTVADLGKCDHVIRVPGVRYEVGVVKRGNGYTLAYDFFGHDTGTDSMRHDGQRLHRTFGDGCKKLAQHYGVQKATRAAQARGHRVQRMVMTDGSIKLCITGI